MCPAQDVLPTPEPALGWRRRHLLRAGGLALTLGPTAWAWGATILAVRVWPAPEYTRVTIESDVELPHTTQFVHNPPRLAVDVRGVVLNPALKELVAKVGPQDPVIQGVRVGQFSNDVVRLVLDLKQPVLPQVFNLPPVAAYRHRLVLDLYAAQVPDPLEALIAQHTEPAGASNRPTPTPTPTPTPKPTTSPAPPANPASGASAVSPPPATAGHDPLGELIASRSNPSAKTPVAQAAPAPPAGPSAGASSTASRDAGGDASKVAIFSGSSKPESTWATGQKDPKLAPTDANAVSRLIVVALDAGHGGEDPGAVGPGGTREKDVVLSLARRLRDRINATRVQGNPLRAYLTRDGDYFVPLQQRVAKARRVQADLFISLHADAFYTARPQGGSVFALSQRAASSAAARWMAQKENQADAVGGLNVATRDAQVRRALLDMSTTAQIKDSLKLGSNFLSEMGRVGKLHKPRVEQAGFAVLKAPDIPSVLVEAAFISNPDEEAKLRSETFQNDLADALMRGIERYFAQNPPLARNRST